MDKYAVVLDPEKEKTAAEGKTCPKCGRQITEDPPKCDHCGTEPFEKKQEDDGGSGGGQGIGGGGL